MTSATQPGRGPPAGGFCPAVSAGSSVSVVSPVPPLPAASPDHLSPCAGSGSPVTPGLPDRHCVCVSRITRDLTLSTRPWQVGPGSVS